MEINIDHVITEPESDKWPGPGLSLRAKLGHLEQELESLKGNLEGEKNSYVTKRAKLEGSFQVMVGNLKSQLDEKKLCVRSWEMKRNTLDAWKKQKMDMLDDQVNQLEQQVLEHELKVAQTKAELEKSLQSPAKGDGVANTQQDDELMMELEELMSHISIQDSQGGPDNKTTLEFDAGSFCGKDAQSPLPEHKPLGKDAEASVAKVGPQLPIPIQRHPSLQALPDGSAATSEPGSQVLDAQRVMQRKDTAQLQDVFCLGGWSLWSSPKWSWGNMIHIHSSTTH